MKNGLNLIRGGRQFDVRQLITASGLRRGGSPSVEGGLWGWRWGRWGAEIQSPFA